MATNENVEGKKNFRQRNLQQVPTDPPFVAYVGNLPMGIVQGDVAKIFHDFDVKNIKLIKDRETDQFKGYGYVEFETLVDLKRALECNGRITVDNCSTPLKIGVAEYRHNRGDSVQKHHGSNSNFRHANSMELNNGDRRHYKNNDKKKQVGSRSFVSHNGFGNRSYNDKPRTSNQCDNFAHFHHHQTAVSSSQVSYGAQNHYPANDRNMGSCNYDSYTQYQPNQRPDGSFDQSNTNANYRNPKNNRSQNFRRNAVNQDFTEFQPDEFQQVNFKNQNRNHSIQHQRNFHRGPYHTQS